MCSKWSLVVILLVSLVNHNDARQSNTERPEAECPDSREFLRCCALVNSNQAPAATTPAPYKQWVDITSADIVRSNGVLAGSDGGQDVYVGMAFYTNGQSEPGKLTLSPPTVRYGNSLLAYTSTSNIKFLNKNPKCNYQWVASSHGVDVANAILVPQGSMDLLIARLNIHGGTQVGKVGRPPPYNKMYYAYGNKEHESINYYEVLVCKPID